MRKIRVSVLIMTVLLACGLIFTACTKKPQEEPEKPETPAPAAAEEAVVELDNETEYEITGIAIRANSSGEMISGDYGDELLGSEQVVPAGTKVKIEYADEYDKDAKYDIKLAYGEGQAIRLTSVPLGDMRSCTIRQDGSLFFVEYESVSSGETVDTRESEQKLLDEYEQRKAEAEAIEKSRQEAEDEAEARRETEEIMNARSQNNSGSVK